VAHCSTLQHTLPHTALQHSVAHCSTLHHTVQHTALQHAATRCYTLFHTAAHFNARCNCIAVCCSVLHCSEAILRILSRASVTALQHTATLCNSATHCDTLQHTATHCDTLQQHLPADNSAAGKEPMPSAATFGVWREKLTLAEVGTREELLESVYVIMSQVRMIDDTHTNASRLTCVSTLEVHLTIPASLHTLQHSATLCNTLQHSAMLRMIHDTHTNES